MRGPKRASISQNTNIPDLPETPFTIIKENVGAKLVMLTST